MRGNSVVLGIILGLITACTGKEPVDPLPVMNTAVSKPAAVDDALEVNQVRKEYDDCIKEKGPDSAECQEIRWMYEDAETQYETMERTRP